MTTPSETLAALLALAHHPASAGRSRFQSVTQPAFAGRQDAAYPTATQGNQPLALSDRAMRIVPILLACARSRDSNHGRGAASATSGIRQIRRGAGPLHHASLLLRRRSRSLGHAELSRPSEGEIQLEQHGREAPLAISLFDYLGPVQAARLDRESALSHNYQRQDRIHVRS